MVIEIEGLILGHLFPKLILMSSIIILLKLNLCPFFLIQIINFQMKENCDLHFEGIFFGSQSKYRQSYGSYGSSSPLCLINYVGFINCRTQLSGGRCMLFIT